MSLIKTLTLLLICNLIASIAFAEKKPKKPKTSNLIYVQKDIERGCVKITTISFEPRTFKSYYGQYTGLSGTIDNSCTGVVSVTVFGEFYDKSGTAIGVEFITKLARIGNTNFQINPAERIQNFVSIGLIKNVSVDAI